MFQGRLCDSRLPMPHTRKVRMITSGWSAWPMIPNAFPSYRHFVRTSRAVDLQSGSICEATPNCSNIGRTLPCQAAPTGWVTTTTEEVQWIAEWCHMRNIPYRVMKQEKWQPSVTRSAWFVLSNVGSGMNVRSIPKSRCAASPVRSYIVGRSSHSFARIL